MGPVPRVEWWSDADPDGYADLKEKDIDADRLDVLIENASVGYMNIIHCHRSGEFPVGTVWIADLHASARGEGHGRRLVEALIARYGDRPTAFSACPADPSSEYRLIRLADDFGFSRLSRNSDSDLVGDLRQVILDRGDSTWFDTLVSRSGHHLFRYDLDVDVPSFTALSMDERDDVKMQIRARIGDAATDAVYDELIDEAEGGGSLCVIWYGRAREAIALAGPLAYTEDRTPVIDQSGSITFVNAHLTIINTHRGSGSTVRVPEMTAEWTPLKVQIDVRGIGGYRWAEIAVPSLSAAYEATVIRTPEDPESGTEAVQAAAV